jgi:excinuclease UvrABC ATPase subunit
LVVAGSVPEVMEHPRSHTGKFLAEKVKKDLQRLKKQGKQPVLGGNLR